MDRKPPGPLNTEPMAKDLKASRAYFTIDPIDSVMIATDKREGEDYVIVSEQVFCYLR